ncbi:unnamed protein product [Allacma fusca]|uniref:Uncharacterized protein n=1 Tax=Allacma fusca TaxID=39272 RepID=A0A8J2NX93_9HEXA|nr:unnamed protein product [Allacma fusca]
MHLGRIRLKRNTQKCHLIALKASGAEVYTTACTSLATMWGTLFLLSSNHRNILLYESFTTFMSEAS